MTAQTDIAKMSARRKNVPTGLELAQRIRDGANVSDLAAEYDVSKSTVSRSVNDAGLSSADGRSTTQLRPSEGARVRQSDFDFDDDVGALAGAACVGEDPELFFPETVHEKRVNIPLAKAICARCDVREVCLSKAQNEERGRQPVGIRGGLDEDERAELVEDGAA